MIDQVVLAKAIKEFQDNMPALIAKMKIESTLHREKYNSLIKAGFSEAQALELCKQIF